jgi:thiosulfate/3-mercaptopyruvate sulfurtransferase
MNGGWIKWTAEQRPALTAASSVSAGRFTATFRPEWVATASDVVAAIDKPGIRIIDARTAAEIGGQTAGNVRRGGFVPSSIPVYWEDLLDPKLKTFKPVEELKSIYESHGILPVQQVIAYCLVGMRASVDLFALHLLGYEHLRNYYGAWEEWGNRDDLPLAR